MLFDSVNVASFRSIESSGAVPLGPITVLVGRNNSGKSALLRAIYAMQTGAPFSRSDIRFGHAEAAAALKASGRIPFKTGAGGPVPDEFDGDDS